MRGVRRVLWLAGFVLAAASPCEADTGTGRVEGAVADESGARLPGVVVKVVPADGAPRPAATTTTDAQGRFSIVQLRPGEHIVRFALDGFSGHRNTRGRV